MSMIIIDVDRILNKFVKWKGFFASWQLGTRPDTDAECNAIRDHRETTLLLRAEVTALAALLIEKGVFTKAELSGQVAQEAQILDAGYEKRFSGFRTTDYGIQIKLPEAADTMKKLHFKP